ncbi:endolysin [Citrobacter phage IME-CF2]|jgi:peptidoglycan LD-endopeptidase CwlK|uniref:Endolysin n=3 Tax=Pseudotevenvirus TaxID=2842979 RepID=A0A1B1IXL3_9CAUD|nr:endolysin [Citrobacter phage Miller]YP_009218588.1 endolysin [Citrobacter phage IME-CF2]YP_009285691.1 endolysin [Citrobacter phage vB_CfrM_CfP1]QPX73252.1 putative endolysin [Citrobacter phage vB_Cfr_Xman]AIK68093.1 endolysin [Citrobacter phage Miller]AKR15896.1 endolysin [Citrobacter phage IME-CF2]ANS06063.1 endolysin [Citrobacter phage vB_CfrM_CfP1]
MFKFSQKSINNLKGVKPELVKVVNRALELSTVDFGVREGLRTVEQQREYVRQGVSQTMASKHITGDAVDLYPSKLPDGWQKNPKVWLPVLEAMKKAGDELGVKLRFGINWKNDPNLPIETKFIDAPHIELA